jgi:hypothetical protein
MDYNPAEIYPPVELHLNSKVSFSNPFALASYHEVYTQSSSIFTVW